MAVWDIGDVTSSLILLIQQAFLTSPAWQNPVQPLVIPEIPGDQLDIGHNVIGIYLYHVKEQKEYGNFQTVGGDAPPVRVLPTAMTLYYQVSARHYQEQNDGMGALVEQQMMSVAIKVLHDYPFLDDATMINGLPVFNNNLMGNENRFNISQQPIPYGDAVHNWTAGQSPLRLSAYYDLSTLFLMPDQARSYTGRVLTYGNYIFLKGAPQITGSQNIIGYTLPGDTVQRQIKVQPAQSPPAKLPPAPVPIDSMISFFGSGFEGDNIQIRLINRTLNVSMLNNTDWSVSLAGVNAVSAIVREKALVEKTSAPADVLPGMYVAQIVVSRTLQLPNGQTRLVTNSSNQFPFIISPRIDTISPLAGTVATITGYIFQYFVGLIDILADKIDVYVGDKRMTRNTTALFNPDEFKMTAPNTMQINLAGPVTPGQQIPLRVIIDGAESGPKWILT